MAKRKTGAPVKFKRALQLKAKDMIKTEGLTTTQVAAKLKLSYGTIYNWRKKRMPLRAA